VGARSRADCGDAFPGCSPSSPNGMARKRGEDEHRPPKKYVGYLCVPGMVESCTVGGRLVHPNALFPVNAST
jgi:hypothetical protein